MDFYNKYITPKYDGYYYSEIAIVKSKETIIDKNLFYINFKKLGRNGFYLQTEELKNIYRNNIPYSKDIVDTLQPSKMYFCYIKIIKDIQNPQLEGNLMLYRFGKRMSNTIKTITYNKTLLLDISRKYNFFNFDKCRFSDNFCNYEIDKDINKEIFFNTISIKNLLRKEKMNNINRSGTICH